MSTETLNHVAQQTLSNYRAAAHSTVGAYRAGGHKLVELVDTTLQGQVYRRTARLAPRATERLDVVRGQARALVAKGIDQSADRTEALITRSSSLAEAQLERLVALAHDIGNPMLANGVDAAARLSLPVANLALTMSTRMASSAAALAEVAGRAPVAHADASAPAPRRARRTAKPAARKVKVTSKVTTKATPKAVAQPVVEAAAKTARPASRRARKATAA